jgi:NAD(P)-dependent dehydrogenase (short-subunit alcohol dehydrogenase family)
MTLTADLSGKIAFVTGASSGLGRHFALVLARAGATVAIGARRLEALETLTSEIIAEGGRAYVVPLDVTAKRSVEIAVDAIARELGTIDILVNNSGVSIQGDILAQLEEQWDAVLDTNLKGAFLVATEVARVMRATGRGGSLINIASILGIRQAGQLGPYAVSKAGLIQLTHIMALELARYDIRVNALAPGYIETDLNRELWATPAGAALLKRIPQRRLGKPEDLDGALLLLASDSSRFMTGATITIDGGHVVSTL